MTITEQIQASAAFLRAHTACRPTLGLVLGSGLGDYADTLEAREVVPFSQIPDFPQPTVAGHTGAFVFGRRAGREVTALQGRLHTYEGHAQQTVTLPIRVLAALGIKTLVLTNAAGGVNTRFRPGDLMLISDHINFSGGNPLTGANLDEFGPRFPDVSDLYTASLRQKIRREAEKTGISLQEGVYMMFAGPNYETPAEVRMARVLGADAVGMSTVPEALVAGHCGMAVVGVSCITNMAAGILPEKLDHREVMATAGRVHDTFHALADLILSAV